MTELRSRPLFTLQLALHPIVDVAATPMGRRRIVPVSGGSFEGERLRGAVHPHGGADWLLERADGSFQQDVRLLLQTDDGVPICMSYRGVRHASADVSARLARGERVDPGDYYLRIVPSFETAGVRYAWLNLVVAVGMGERLPDAVIYRIFEIL